MELTRTPRLLLRHWERTDLQAFFDLYSRPDVMRWLGPQPRRALASLSEARDRLGRWHTRERGLVAPLGYWAIVPCAEAAGQQADGPPAGTIVLLPLTDDHGLAGPIEVGWHLHPRCQGQGLATDAARAVVAMAAQAGIAEVLALTDPDNVASQAVAVRLAMRDEGLTDRWFGLTTRQFRLTTTPG